MTKTLLKSYLKFAKGFQPASLAQFQLGPSFIRRELEYTEPHYEDNELSLFHKQNKNISSSVYLCHLSKQSQTIHEGFSIWTLVHAHETIQLLFISIPVPSRLFISHF